MLPHHLQRHLAPLTPLPLHRHLTSLSHRIPLHPPFAPHLSDPPHPFHRNLSAFLLLRNLLRKHYKIGPKPRGSSLLEFVDFQKPKQ